MIVKNEAANNAFPSRRRPENQGHSLQRGSFPRIVSVLLLPFDAYALLAFILGYQGEK